MEWPKLKRDHIGLKVKTLKKLRNGYGEFPAGTIATVTYSRGGLELRTDSCKCCGMRMNINKVDYFSVELLTPTKEG